MDHLLLYSLGLLIAKTWPQEAYGEIMDGLQQLHGELIARKNRALASAATSAATALPSLAALCILRAHAVRSAVQRSPLPLFIGGLLLALHLPIPLGGRCTGRQGEGP